MPLGLGDFQGISLERSASWSLFAMETARGGWVSVVRRGAGAPFLLCSYLNWRRPHVDIVLEKGKNFVIENKICVKWCRLLFLLPYIRGDRVSRSLPHATISGAANNDQLCVYVRILISRAMAAYHRYIERLLWSTRLRCIFCNLLHVPPVC